MARRLGLSLLVLFLGILLSQDPASAARKKKKRKKAPAAPPQEIVVTEDDIFRVEVSVRPPANKKKKNKNKAKKGKKGKKGKKKKKAPAAAQYSVACLDRIPGEVVNQEDGSMRFVSYSEKIRSMKGNKKQARKNRNAIQLLNKILAAARDKCIRPPFSSFDRYDGEFGTEQAATLLYRATMGPRPGEIQQAVNDGLEAAVNRLFVTADEPVKQFIKEDLWCDGRLPWDEDNEECDASDPDDIYFAGVRYGLDYMSLTTSNSFNDRLMYFLQDERMAASMDVVNRSCRRHQLRRHIEAYERAVASGDFKQFMRDMDSDFVMQTWLDGDNNSGDSPNENYAREKWELGTIGPTDLDGNPVYTPADIANSALAHSGYTVIEHRVGDNELCYLSYSNDLHAPGNKVIFQGTPYEAVVQDHEDVLEASFAHPRTSEHLAEDIWDNFIGSKRTKSGVKELAKIIRDKNYNLREVMRVVFLSKAMYASENRKSIVKKPRELLVGLLRATGIPVSSYRTFDWMLGTVGQRSFRPDSVFGTNEIRRASQLYQVERRSRFVDIIARSFDEEEFDFHARFLSHLPDSRTVIAEVARDLDVRLNTDQTQQLDDYMNFYPTSCSSDCNGLDYRLVRDVFDSHPDGNWERELRGLLIALASMPDFMLK